MLFIDSFIFNVIVIGYLIIITSILFKYKYLYNIASIVTAIMPSLSLILFLTLYLGLGIWSALTLTKSFKKYKNYSSNKPSDPKYLALTRDDAHNWNKQRILIGCFILFPIRFLLFCSFILGCFIFTIFFMIFGNRTLLNKSFIIFMYTYARFVTRLMCIVKQQFKSRSVLTPIIISNHVNWFDIFYIVTKFAPLSFMAKQEVKKWPVIGTIAQVLQCVFIDRDSQQARKQARENIKSRIQQIVNHVKNKFPLVIFPQGTTSNGKGLLTFKNGAFQHLSSITAVCLKYQCDNFQLGMDEIGQTEHFMLMMSQLAVLKVKKLTFQPKQGENAQEYQNRCRKQMGQALGVPLTQAGYRDKLALIDYRKSKEQKKQQ